MEWILSHGAGAPADLLRWARNPTNSSAARHYLEEVADIAAGMLAKQPRALSLADRLARARRAGGSGLTLVKRAGKDGRAALSQRLRRAASER